MPDAAVTGQAVPHILVANPSADLYGSDRMLLEAVRGFRARGWRVTVTCSQTGPLVEPLERAGADVVVQPVPVLRKASTNPKGLALLAGSVIASLPRLVKFVRRLRPAAIYVNTVTVPVWIGIARLTRTPVVVHVHEAEASVRPVLRKALSAPLALASRVIFNSQVSRSVSRNRSLERGDRVRVIHNGVGAPAEVRPARQELTPPFRLVYLGRLSPRKGVDLVLSAAEALCAAGVETTVDLVGAVFPTYEWYEDELRAQVEQGRLDGSVAFHGFRSPIWPYLADADVAVVPSRLDESFGNTVVEALLAARPVIVSDHTGLREAASGFEAAVRIRPDDATALAEALEGIRRRWLHFRSAASADAISAAKRYGVERFQERVAAVVEEVLP